MAAVPTGSQVVQLQNQTGTVTLLKEDGIRVILSDVFLKDSGRRVLSKPLNYSKLADIEQGEKEATGKFLDREKPFADSLRLILKVKREM